jgi:hypothetical protein
MVIWFVVIAWLGIVALVRRPEVLLAIGPRTRSRSRRDTERRVHDPARADRTMTTVASTARRHVSQPFASVFVSSITR